MPSGKLVNSSRASESNHRLCWAQLSKRRGGALSDSSLSPTGLSLCSPAGKLGNRKTNQQHSSSFLCRWFLQLKGHICCFSSTCVS